MRFKEDGSVGDSILDVEARTMLLQNDPSYLLSWSDPQQRACITPCAIEPLGGKKHLHGQCGHLPQASLNGRHKYQRTDGRHLPFADGEFDWVFCSEVIEHAGGVERQYELLSELARVARKGIFVTTSNRWHPFEFNTALPLLHWLPTPLWRRALKLSGKGEWASDAALNLLDANGLHNLASLLPGKPTIEVGHIRLGGIKAHFFLQIRKNAIFMMQKKAA